MKHLILDVGGVLVYPSAGNWSTPVRLAEALGERASDLDTERFDRARREAAVGWLDESQLVEDLDVEQALRLGYLRALDERMGWGLSEDALQMLAADFTRNIARYGFYDDIAPWLNRWKGKYVLGILSDAMPSLPVFLDQYGILRLFDAAVFSTRVGAIKPDPRMYAAILDALQADPADCLFVDDRPCNLAGATRAGMRAVQMLRPNMTPEGLWDGARVTDFTELDALLGAWA